MQNRLINYAPAVWWLLWPVKEPVSSTHLKYPFTFSYAGQDTANVEIAVNDGKAIENKLIYGSVSGKKITENGEEDVYKRQVLRNEG